MSNYKKLFLILIALILSLLNTSPLTAQLRVCNDTLSILDLALGYQQGNVWQTHGWWPIAPMSCSSIIKDKLKSRYYYIYVEDNKGEQRFEGDIFLCVKDNKFDINGVSNCYVRGFQKAAFQEIDTHNNTSWTVHLTNNNKLQSAKE